MNGSPFAPLDLVAVACDNRNPYHCGSILTWLVRQANLQLQTATSGSAKCLPSFPSEFPELPKWVKSSPAMWRE
jgi:hypothetical protein